MPLKFREKINLKIAEYLIKELPTDTNKKKELSEVYYELFQIAK